MPFTVTTNASGIVTATKVLPFDMIVGRITSFSDGNYETIEFFDLYVYTRGPSSQDVSSGGGSGSSGGGPAGGGTARSPENLVGTIFRRGQELVVTIKNGVASTVYHVLIPYQVIER